MPKAEAHSLKYRGGDGKSHQTENSQNQQEVKNKNKENKSFESSETENGVTKSSIKSPSESGSAPKSPISDVDLIVGDRIVQLYSLKAYYLGQLGQLESQAKRDYSSLPKEQRNVIGKKGIVDRYTGVVIGQLDRCDSEVYALLDELRGELEAANADTSIIGTIREAYENEKNMKKAYYLKLIGE